MAKTARMFIVPCNGGTVLVMIASEIFAQAMRPTTTIVHPVCSAGFIVKQIPFLTLNISIALPILVHVVTSAFFESLDLALLVAYQRTTDGNSSDKQTCQKTPCLTTVTTD